jgi:hypothetical protein
LEREPRSRSRHPGFCRGRRAFRYIGAICGTGHFGASSTIGTARLHVFDAKLFEP